MRKSRNVGSLHTFCLYDKIVNNNAILALAKQKYENIFTYSKLFFKTIKSTTERVRYYGHNKRFKWSTKSFFNVKFLLKQNIIYRPQSKSSANNLVKYDAYVYNSLAGKFCMIYSL